MKLLIIFSFMISTVVMADTCVIFPGVEVKLTEKLKLIKKFKIAQDLELPENLELNTRLDNSQILSIRDKLNTISGFGGRVSIHKFNHIDLPKEIIEEIDESLADTIGIRSILNLLKNHHYFLCLSNSTVQEDKSFKVSIMKSLAQGLGKPNDVTDTIQGRACELKIEEEYEISNGEKPILLEEFDLDVDFEDKNLYSQIMLSDMWVLGPQTQADLKIRAIVRYTFGNPANEVGWREESFEIGHKVLNEKQSVELLIAAAKKQTESISASYSNLSDSNLVIDKAQIENVKQVMQRLNNDKTVKSIQVKNILSLSYWGYSFPVGEMLLGKKDQQFNPTGQSNLDFKNFEGFSEDK